MFRINKGVLDVDDNEMVNKYIPERERRIPFRNKVYIWMADNKVAKQFLQDAEAEGFMFENGAKPTEKETSDIFRIFCCIDVGDVLVIVCSDRYKNR